MHVDYFKVILTNPFWKSKGATVGKGLLAVHDRKHHMDRNLKLVRSGLHHFLKLKFSKLKWESSLHDIISLKLPSQSPLTKRYNSMSTLEFILK